MKSIEATVEDMLESIEGQYVNVEVNTKEGNFGTCSLLKRCHVQHDGAGLRMIKPHRAKDGERDKDKDYFQGRVGGIEKTDKALLTIGSKSWFVHGPNNTTFKVIF